MRYRITMLFMMSLLISACGVDSAERNNAGNWHHQQGDYTQAIDAYLAGQVVDPDNLVLYLNAGQTFAISGDVDNALAAYELVIEQSEESESPLLAAEAYYNMGNMYVDLGLYQDAIQAYRESLIQNPENADTRYNLELAMSFIDTPTPEPEEMQTEPDEGQADASATPTNQPLDNEAPTPTPTPQPEAPPNETIEPNTGITGTQTGPTPSTPAPLPESTLSVNEAIQLLEPISEDAKTLGEYRNTAVPFGTSESGKDW